MGLTTQRATTECTDRKDVADARWRKAASDNGRQREAGEAAQEGGARWQARVHIAKCVHAGVLTVAYVLLPAGLVWL